MTFLDMMTDPFDATMAQIDFEARMGVPVRYRTFPDFSLPFEVEALTEECDHFERRAKENDKAEEERKALWDIVRAAQNWFDDQKIDAPKKSVFAKDPPWLEAARATE